MFLSGPINKFVENTTKKGLLSTILIFVFVNIYLGWIREVDFVTDGYNLFNFVMLYLIGRYLRLYYNSKLSKGTDVIIFFGTSVLTAVVALALFHRGCDTFRAFCYNSPFVLISAISLFLFFTKLHFASKTINYLASSCLAIYLMQEGGIHCYKQIRTLYLSSGLNLHFAYITIVFFLLSMIVPLFVDKIRIKIFGKAEAWIAENIDMYFFKKWFE